MKEMVQRVESKMTVLDKSISDRVDEKLEQICQDIKQSFVDTLSSSETREMIRRSASRNHSRRQRSRGRPRSRARHRSKTRARSSSSSRSSHGNKSGVEEEE